MSVERKRWAQLAQELRFHQLEVIRHQAEGWRNGLAGLTGLLGAVIVVKGPDTVATLGRPSRWAVVALLGTALLSLTTATLTAVRAASGVPGSGVLLSGDDLRNWTYQEAQLAPRAIRRAATLASAGIAALALAIGIAWLVPPRPMVGERVTVDFGGSHVCGELIGADQGVLELRVAGGSMARIPLATVGHIGRISSC